MAGIYKRIYIKDNILYECFKWNGSVENEVFPDWFVDIIERDLAWFQSHIEYGTVIEYNQYSKEEDKYLTYAVAPNEWLAYDGNLIHNFNNKRFMELFERVD